MYQREVNLSRTRSFGTLSGATNFSVLATLFAFPEDAQIVGNVAEDAATLTRLSIIYTHRGASGRTKEEGRRLLNCGDFWLLADAHLLCYYFCGPGCPLPIPEGIRPASPECFFTCPGLGSRKSLSPQLRWKW